VRAWDLRAEGARSRTPGENRWWCGACLPGSRAEAEERTRGGPGGIPRPPRALADKRAPRAGSPHGSGPGRPVSRKRIPPRVRTGRLQCARVRSTAGRAMPGRNSPGGPLKLSGYSAPATRTRRPPRQPVHRRHRVRRESGDRSVRPTTPPHGYVAMSVIWVSSVWRLCEGKSSRATPDVRGDPATV